MKKSNKKRNILIIILLMIVFIVAHSVLINRESKYEIDYVNNDNDGYNFVYDVTNVNCMVFYLVNTKSQHSMSCSYSLCNNMNISNIINNVIGKKHDKGEIYISFSDTQDDDDPSIIIDCMSNQSNNFDTTLGLDKIEHCSLKECDIVMDLDHNKLISIKNQGEELFYLYVDFQ